MWLLVTNGEGQWGHPPLHHYIVIFLNVPNFLNVPYQALVVWPRPNHMSQSTDAQRDKKRGRAIPLLPDLPLAGQDLPQKQTQSPAVDALHQPPRPDSHSSLYC